MIIVTGMPGSGKTTLSKRLSDFLNVPVVNRDEMKEILFDDLGMSDRTWSKKLGHTSYNLLYFVIEKLLSTKNTFIIESNFHSQSLAEWIQSYKEKYNFTPILIHCYADLEVLYNRVLERDKSDDRHRGHVGIWGNLEDFKTNFLSNNDIADIEGKLIKVDTTNFDKVNYVEIFNDVHCSINEN